MVSDAEIERLATRLDPHSVHGGNTRREARMALEDGGDLTRVARQWLREGVWPHAPRFGGIRPSVLGQSFEPTATLAWLRRLERAPVEAREELAERMDMLTPGQASLWFEPLSDEEAVQRAVVYESGGADRVSSRGPGQAVSKRPKPVIALPSPRTLGVVGAATALIACAAFGLVDGTTLTVAAVALIVLWAVAAIVGT